jgi:hypothetical protein
LVASEVYTTYWRFAAERQRMYYRRLEDPTGPWTDDPILARHRFTNAYRVSDRVSQHLVREIQWNPARSQAPAEVFFRTILFKIFNKTATWNALEAGLGRIAWQSFDLATASSILDAEIAAGRSIYSAAYIMPSPPYGHRRKHANHLEMLSRMMDEGLPGRIVAAESLEDVYRLILAWPSMGPFLAFQYAIDLNYSSMIDFDESTFVIAGPGAHDGISKCFVDTGGMTAEQVIMRVTQDQESEFAKLGLDFPGLFGRRLQPIDQQNLFCEISKYARVAHPEYAGIAGRTKIKQGYAEGGDPLPQPFMPPKWNLVVPEYETKAIRKPSAAQGDLFGA